MLIDIWDETKQDSTTVSRMDLRGSSLNKCPNFVSAYFLWEIQLGAYCCCSQWHFCMNPPQHEQPQNHSAQHVLSAVCWAPCCFAHIDTLPNPFQQLMYICLLNLKYSASAVSVISTRANICKWHDDVRRWFCLSVILFPSCLVWCERDLCPMSSPMPAAVI